MADCADITYSPSDGVSDRWTPANSTRKVDQTAFTALESETRRAVSSLFATDREVSQVLERIKRLMHPRAGRLDFTVIARSAIANSQILLSSWLPDGKRMGSEWLARNPTRPDRTLGSFKISLKSGRWADFATGDGGGDLISLRAYLDGTSQRKAAISVAEELGL
jgi:hypothetical protein